MDFRIIGCQVNGAAAQPSLLVDLGDVAPQRASMGDWLMTCSAFRAFCQFHRRDHPCSGIRRGAHFVDSGRCDQHAPVDWPGSVDLPGRDAIPDFLGCDSMTGAIVTPQALRVRQRPDRRARRLFWRRAVSPSRDDRRKCGDAQLRCHEPALVCPVRQSGWRRQTVRAVRSDGKALPASNCWVSKSKDDNLRLGLLAQSFRYEQTGGADLLADLYRSPSVGPRPGPEHCWRTRFPVCRQPAVQHRRSR